MEIKIVKATSSKEMKPENELGFGQYFSDHMFVMDYEEGRGWYDARIVPFGNISLHPASTVLHYGAEIFEGLKIFFSAGSLSSTFPSVLLKTTYASIMFTTK
jgi:branched-chain amino acid aminotransferase